MSTSTLAAVAACVLAPVLWAAPASAAAGYPPTGPGGGGKVTFGGGTPTVTTLPHTGQDIALQLEAGAVFLLVGAGLAAGARRRRSVR